MMIYFCWWVFPLVSASDIDPETGKITMIKALRNAIYRLCAIVIAIISVVARVVPEEASAPVASAAPGIDPAHVAAISAALHLHRKSDNKNR